MLYRLPDGSERVRGVSKAVKAVSSDILQYRGRNHVEFGVVAYFGAADVIERCFDYTDALGIVFGYGDWVVAWPAIDVDVAEAYDVV